MHKGFYASGFLYHPKSQQILLQQLYSANNSSWTLFGKTSAQDKTGEEVFKDIFYEVLNLKIKLNNIKMVYSYFSKELNKRNIYYAEVKSRYKHPVSGNSTFAWFTFKQVQKLNLSEQIRHDILVGQRVIDSSIRKSLGLRTIG